MRKIGGVLCFWETACDILSVNFGKLTLVLKKRHLAGLLMVWLAGCSHFRQHFRMTMPCKLVDNHAAPVRFYDIGVSAGFPSPADDYKEKKLDLNELLIKQPEATFFAKASGDSMIGAGIHDGDMLIVDRSITASDGRIVIAVLNGELTVKRFKLLGRTAQLHSENSKYTPITLHEGDSVSIWGVVTNVIHSFD